MAWHAEEVVRQIYHIDDPALASQFVAQLGVDLQDQPCMPEVNSLGRTLIRWTDQITAWHQARVSNGTTEAINNLIKRIKRSGFGFTRFRNYRIRVLLYARKPQLEPTRHHHPPLKSDEPLKLVGWLADSIQRGDRIAGDRGGSGMLDVALESIRGAVAIGIFVVFVWIGRRRRLTSEPGWRLVVVGFGLLAFGSVVDITDNFESLNKFVVVGNTDAQAYVEKVVGYLFGSVALAVGFSLWLPRIGSAVEDRDQFKGDLEVAEAKFRSFFDQSRSALFIEDFSSLEEWFDDLRAEGVVDLGRYFDDHPGALAEQVGELRILEANQAAADIYEAASQAEMCRRHRPDVLGEGAFEVFRSQLISLWGGQNHMEFDMQALTHKGNEFAALLHCVAPVVDGCRDLSRVMVTITNVSRLQSLVDELRANHSKLEEAHAVLAATQRELLQAQKLESIGSLAAGIAHEINTPTQYVGDNLRFFQECLQDFTTLHNSTEALVVTAEAQGLLTEETASYRAVGEEAGIEYVYSEAPSAIREALEGVDRIASIVRALKDFSHPGAEGRTPVDVNRALESTITVARSEWNRVAEMVTDLDPALPMVPAVGGPLNQVFLNLIINATHAIADANGHGTNGKGTISIRTCANGDSVEITVSDTGCGIPDEIRDRIFDPFFTTKEVGRGTGQGLSIARSVIVEQHQGRLHVESEPGRGTTFTISLPLDTVLDGDAS